MILFDGVHMASDESLEELHREAEAIGIKRSWFQDDGIIPHYDIFGKQAERLTRNCTTRELIIKAVRW